MRTAGIVVVHPFSKRELQMRFTQRYHIIQTLSTDASDYSFAKSIGRGRMCGGFQHFDTLARNFLVQTKRERLVAVVEQKLVFSISGQRFP